jgi:phosphoserine phosphatase
VTLVVQPADAGQAAAIARLGGAQSVAQVGERAFRLASGAANAAVLAYAQEHRLDVAAVGDAPRFAELQLLALDMDSTLISIECIDELGEFAGKRAQIAAITAQAMRGEIDYAQSLKTRVGLLAGLGAQALQRVYDERLRLTPGAETLVQACRKHGVKLLLVSGGFTFFTERLKQRLGLDYTLANRLELRDDRLTGRLAGEIVDAAAKARCFGEVARSLGAARERTVAIGDGANDLPMMALAGTSVAFRAKPLVQAQAGCALNYSGLDGVIHLFG